MTVVEEVKQRVDIVEIISRYVQLKKAGKNFSAPCPFHTERTPSFVVFPHTGTWRCFGACGVGGDVYNFLMRKENLDFREALEMLAREVGVDLDNDYDGQSEKQRKDLYEINGAAALYFREVLLNHPAAEAARTYLAGRQIDTVIAERFQLGFAVDSWDGLRNHLEKRGYTVEQQIQAGLIKQNEARNSTYDAFRGRLMIPIFDRQSRVIGFGGRILASDKASGSAAGKSKPSGPKYLNTSETQLFHKSNVVYGINFAHQAIRSSEHVVIVEGYMDVIAAHQHGFENVVACMGTSLTPEQLQQLQRYTNEYLLALDADAAGQQATIRGLNQARQALKRVRRPKLSSSGRLHLQEQLGANLKIVPMPEGRDPDDVIRQGAEQWTALIESALPLVDYYLQNIITQHDLQSAQGKGQAVSDVAPLIAELGDEIEQQHYIQQLSRLIQIDESTIASRVQAAARTLQVQVKNESKSAGGQKGPEREYNKKPKFGKPEIKRPTSFVPDAAAPPADLNPSELEPPPFDMEDEWIPEMDMPLDMAPPSGSELNSPDLFAPDSSIPDASAQYPAESITITGSGPSSFEQEDYLLACLLWEPNMLVWLAGTVNQLQIDALNAADFNKADNREIFKALRQFITSDELWDYDLFRESLVGYLHGSLDTLLDYAGRQPQIEPLELQAELVKVLLRIRINNLKMAAKNIRYLQDDAQRSGDDELAKLLSSSFNHNTRARFHFEKTLSQLNQALSAQPQPKQKVQIH